MSTFTVKVKWGKEVYEDVELNTGEEPLVFKAQLFALTGVQPHKQKVMIKGAALKDDTWDNFKPKVKNGATLLLMGSRDEDHLKAPDPAQKTKFIEDMDESELQTAMKMPAGLTNLGNTCYMNATVQCLKSVPEFREALVKYEGNNASNEAAASSYDATGLNHAMTSAMRDLYRSMESSATVHPFLLLNTLHTAFPAFAQRGEQGGYQQQDANECWVQLLEMIRRQLTTTSYAQQSSNDSSNGASATPATRSVIDQYFGLEFATEIKCVEAPDEASTKSVEKVLQYNCYIDKEVKYLSSGLKNYMNQPLTKRSATLERDAEYTKTSKVSRLPGYLTIQMMRFQFKQKDAVNAKILKDIKFPMMLDTFELCTDDLQQKLVPMRTKFKDHEDRIVEQSAELKAKGGREAALKKGREDADAEGVDLEPYYFKEDPGSNNSGYYELQAILTHKGRSSNSGHYVAWVKHKTDTWIECNDDDVRPVHVDDVMKLSGGGDWHTAYLLIYGPRKLPKHTPAPAAEKTVTEESKAETEKMETS